ncbi:biotin--[acetyl-CoA-carboxylase] ligase [sulfur-oxidizing endosymbiont of Gigantopelta aegis]|uniref:biotin--[acetyl-CoA-carboxylase] ligase n=1 Tax=sulfur-oxidizing endosymbiont of Gigantopelta aegis TaxID=2794934 RepID=UPI0018DC84D7|nr:biotin--[acetyl-CoA-carboxylase] ligase [sulfur-oxidizing endosymbiont of Gigantopelta aegis]
MNKLDSEYELFKALCNKEPVAINTKNTGLIESLLAKNIGIKQTANNYRIKQECIALSEKLLRNNLDTAINNSINPLNITYQTNSTNKQITQQSQIAKYSVLLSEYQSSGQGRREKQWFSPLATNICLSMQFELQQTQNIQFIPLITAVAVCRSLKQLGVEACQIKWPNDIYLEGKKLAGILVESRFNAEKKSVYVVGIGLNVNMDANEDIDQLWTSLRINQNKRFDRNIIVSLLLSELIATYNRISEFNAYDFVRTWHQYDYLYGETITIVDSHGSYTAMAQGLANDGALLIKRSSKKEQDKIYSAEVSIKKSGQIK